MLTGKFDELMKEQIVVIGADVAMVTPVFELDAVIPISCFHVSPRHQCRVRAATAINYSRYR